MISSLILGKVFPPSIVFLHLFSFSIIFFSPKLYTSPPPLDFGALNYLFLLLHFFPSLYIHKFHFLEYFHLTIFLLSIYRQYFL